MKRMAAYYNRRATCQEVALYCDYIAAWVLQRVLLSETVIITVYRYRICLPISQSAAERGRQ